MYSLPGVQILTNTHKYSQIPINGRTLIFIFHLSFFIFHFSFFIFHFSFFIFHFSFFTFHFSLFFYFPFSFFIFFNISISIYPKEFLSFPITKPTLTNNYIFFAYLETGGTTLVT